LSTHQTGIIIIIERKVVKSCGTGLWF